MQRAKSRIRGDHSLPTHGSSEKEKAGKNTPQTGFVGKHPPTVFLLIYLGNTSLLCNYVEFQTRIYFSPTHTLCHLIFSLPYCRRGLTSLTSCRSQIIAEGDKAHWLQAVGGHGVQGRGRAVGRRSPRRREAGEAGGSAASSMTYAEEMQDRSFWTKS